MQYLEHAHTKHLFFYLAIIGITINLRYFSEKLFKNILIDTFKSFSFTVWLTLGMGIETNYQ